MKTIMHKISLLTFLIVVMFSTNSCEDEASLKYLTMRCKFSNGESFNVVADGENYENFPMQLFYGPKVNSATGEEVGYYWNLVSFGDNVVGFLFSSDIKNQMHFEGDDIHGMNCRLEEHPFVDYVPNSGVIDLSYYDDEYIEGTFSGTFVKLYPLVSGEPPHTPQAEDTIYLYDGYFKVSIWDISATTGNYQ